MTYHLAVDIGASSGRHILGHLENGRMVLEEVYRFDNIQQQKNGHDCWDVETLWDHILAGLCACRAAGKIPATMGIDTWAVDFVLVDKGGQPVGDAVAYRDARTEGVRDRLEAEGVLSFADHYARAGIQYQPFNTAYQLAALKAEHPEQLEQGERLLMIPEYFNYLLTGKMVNEYTNASSTALVNAANKTWDDALIAALGLPRKIFGELQMPGTSVGHFTSAVQEIAGFDCEVLLPATHDTASAFLAVPARDDNAVYISSGTWSLLGVENFSPITTPESMAANFTNEGGYDYRFRYLKNIMGLWMIQSVRREWNGVAYVAGKQQRTAAEKQWSYAELEAEARACEDFAGRVDVNDVRFLSPASMVEEVKAACAEAGGPVPQTVGEVMACIYHSLADCYAAAIRQLQSLTGKTYTAIHIVGGGSKDGYLNALTAKAAGLPVFAGPTEGTALGNLMVQMIATGEFADLAAARAAIHTTGNYPGKARNFEELKADFLKAASFIPGKKRINLHACYAVFGEGEWGDRDKLEYKHFEPWVAFAKEHGLGIDFNLTCFSHPMVKDGLTLSHPDESVRRFWIDHCKASRRIAQQIGEALGDEVLNNVWIPDGFKDIPADRMGPRMRLKAALDEIFAESCPNVIDCVESKVFGIGLESMTVGSNEFYTAYAATHPGVYNLLDAGHYHPTEFITDKIPAMLCFFDKVPLHVTRPVRWDSDHVVLFDDETKEIMKEVVRNDALDKVLIGLDFFDASINRIAAWVVGSRAAQKALLFALLQPNEKLKELQDTADFTAKMVLMETAKTLPFAEVWEEYCRRQNVPMDGQWLEDVRAYETEVLKERG